MGEKDPLESSIENLSEVCHRREGNKGKTLPSTVAAVHPYL